MTTKFPGPVGTRGVWRLGVRLGPPQFRKRWLGKSHYGTVVEVPPQGRQRKPHKGVRTDCGLVLKGQWLTRISPGPPLCKRCLKLRSAR